MEPGYDEGMKFNRYVSETVSRRVGPGHDGRLARAVLLLPLLLLLLTGPAVAEGFDAAGLSEKTGLTGGLVVVAGVKDAALLESLGKDGHWLVQGWAADDETVDAVRARLTEAGVYGLASVARYDPQRGLPYGDGFANVVVLDREALGADAPTAEECNRVAIAGGWVLIREKGAVTARQTQRDDRLGDWTHYDGGPSGNPVGTDTVAGVATALRWRAYPTSEPVGSDRDLGVLVEGGRSISTIKRLFLRSSDGQGPGWLVCRDARNGTLLWSRLLADSRDVPSRHSTIFKGGKLYAFLEEDKPMVTLDAATGEQVAAFDEGAPAGEKDAVAHLVGGRLFQASKGELFALDAATGERLWRTGSQDKAIQYFVADENRVYAIIGKPGKGRGSISPTIEAIVAYDAAKGQEVWRFDEVKDSRCYRIVLAGDRVVVPYFPAKGKGGGGGGASAVTQMAVLDAADGKMLWNDPTQRRAQGHFFPTAVMDQQILSLGHSVNSYDLKTGDHIANWRSNEGCIDKRMTPGLLFAGFMVYTDPTAEVPGTNLPWVARTHCDTAVTPAAGLVFSPATNCGCVDFLRGTLAFSTEQPRPVTGERLVKGPAPAPAGGVAAEPPWPAFLGGPQRVSAADVPAGFVPKRVRWARQIATFPDSPLAQDWRRDEIMGYPVSAPTVGYGLIYVALPQQHRIAALDAATGEGRWTFHADARIDGPPTLANGLAVFGSRDGWVYALDARNGRLVWKFHAAASDRLITEVSNIESASPAFASVLVANGAVYAAAGRSTVIDGGILLWKLDLSTGRELARVSQDTPPAELSRRFVENRTYNTSYLRDIATQQLLVLSGDGTMILSSSGWFDLDLKPVAEGADGPILSSRSIPLHSRAQDVARHLSGRDYDTFAVARLAVTREVAVLDFGDSMTAVKPAVFDTPPAARRGLSGKRQDAMMKEALWTRKLKWDETRALAARPDVIHTVTGKEIATLNATTGEALHTWTLDDVQVLNDGIAIGDNALYLICEDGTVICFDAEQAASDPGSRLAVDKSGDDGHITIRKLKESAP